MDWEISLADKMSDPAKRAADALRDMEKLLREVGKGEEAVEEKSEGMFGELFKAETVAHAFEKLQEKVFDLGKEFVKTTIESGEFHRNAGLALESILGKGPLAESVLEQAEDLSMKLHKPLQEVTRTYLDLTAAKIPPVNVPIIIQGAQDLAARLMRPEAAGKVISSFERIALQGQVQTGQLRRLFAGTGLDVEKLYKRLHLSMSEGGNETVKAAKVIRGAMETIHDQMDEPLGALAVKQGEGLGGAMIDLKNGLETFLGNIDKSPEFTHLSASLHNLASDIAHTDPSGLIKAFTWVAEAADKGIYFLRLLGGSEGASRKQTEDMIKDEIRHGNNLAAFRDSTIHFATDILPEFAGKGIRSAWAAANVPFGGEASDVTAPWKDKPEHHQTGGRVAMAGEAGEELIIPMRGSGGLPSGLGGTTHVEVNIGDVVVHSSGKVDEDVAEGIREKLREQTPGMAKSFLERAATGAGGR